MSATTVRRGGVTRDQRQPPRWASRAARDLHLQPRTVEARIHSTTRPTAQEELATILRRLIETGNLPLAEKILAPIEAAMAGLPVPAFSPELVAVAVRADEEEAIARDTYLMTPTPAHRRAWMLKIEEQRATSRPLALALRALDREGHS